MKTLLLLTFCLLLFAQATAVAGVTVNRLTDDLNQWTNSDSGQRGECIYGNPNPPAIAIPDWIQGDSSFTYYIAFPSALDCSCQLGFHIDDVSLMMQFGIEDVPVQFEMSAELAPMDWRMMPLPGRPDCTGDAYTVDIQQAGFYEITIPLHEQCGCAYLDYSYFITLNILTPFAETMQPDLILDAFPLGYQSYIHDGNSWWDLLFNLGFPGELVMKANVVCCDLPVLQESNTMGELKSMYR